ncbi:3-phenylpropionate/cinnamic acid dioxygenase subunit beta (plasmid) [Haloferax mediterranei ATCC 33500]|uniref:3-phenylpropionate/cinnamic acid dioxygenase subunit beta n=1 Tax=Haloferax mediterranei (strain ATCC 33500 / DSM 1411 / JCM 8866 / NBRC 14739 / NCIMB 2177 / R-4) TaxID=523841 RepID=I3R9R4_HALMT|nr:aromatic-ring-hydroxylating dioxygenase subunit beta [Haloferax mediterranei]AFK20974.1 small terminal subunit of phenylpropionate dioxygenase [Haloferax mediterranei ATCC 33500]AHZ24162.1 phenylpropionate dioxygenase [Haloferax mediterranei ATCC 33500]EMA05239.1 small terminal subunit of phenylpropionate dioxygenase [Haloferax mediterranei ATCC 33500]MDX5989957.1 aromatic-ring-hydroxylating dioxygenase subunit beta [Haloferax mediterranei ATCC 33500]QCQ77145.1 3-phenylpropionate/cinnamic a
MSERFELRLECEEFLFDEAERLDDGKLHEWLELLTDDVEYRVPRRVTRERGSEQSSFSEDGFLYREDMGTLTTRVERYDREYAWAENPPSRTRRFVSNVRVHDESDDEIRVKSNLLLYRNQGDTTEHDLLVGEREDQLRRVDGALKLARRTVYLDQTILATRNLSFFL